jgi:hypothetical protein
MIGGALASKSRHGAPAERLALGRMLGRCVAYLWWSVTLALVPIFFSWLFLPSNAGLAAAISHGEVAILAETLAAVSIGKAVRDKPSGTELLVSAQVGVLVTSIIVLVGASGRAQHLSASTAGKLSVWLLLVEVVLGLSYEILRLAPEDAATL